MEDLHPELMELMQEALQAISTSDARYSRFRVGASASLRGGQIVRSSNQENAVYGLTICAEHNLISSIGSMSDVQVVEAIAITADHEGHDLIEPVFPCGSCRQVLIEQEVKQQSNIKVIVGGLSMPCLVFKSAKDLLPFAFTGTVLTP